MLFALFAGLTETSDVVQNLTAVSQMAAAFATGAAVQSTLGKLIELHAEAGEQVFTREALAAADEECRTGHVSKRSALVARLLDRYDNIGAALVHYIHNHCAKPGEANFKLHADVYAKPFLDHLYGHRLPEREGDAGPTTDARANEVLKWLTIGGYV